MTTVDQTAPESTPVELPTIYLVNEFRVFVGVGKALANPEEPEDPIIPFEGRKKEPPTVGQNQCARSLGFLPDDDWEVIPSYVGFEYWTVDRQHIRITEPGVVPPDGHLTEDPGPTPAEKWFEYQQLARNALQSIQPQLETMLMDVIAGTLAKDDPSVTKLTTVMKGLKEIINSTTQGDCTLPLPSLT